MGKDKTLVSSLGTGRTGTLALMLQWCYTKVTDGSDGQAPLVPLPCIFADGGL